MNKLSRLNQLVKALEKESGTTVKKQILKNMELKMQENQKL